MSFSGIQKIGPYISEKIMSDKFDFGKKEDISIVGYIRQCYSNQDTKRF